MCGWVALASLASLTACTPPDLAHVDALNFFKVEAGTTSRAPFAVVNLGTTAERVELRVMSGADYSVEPDVLEVPAGARAEAIITLKPSTLGIRSGVLRVRSRSSAREVSLRGASVGPKLGIAKTVRLPLAALINGAPAVVTTHVNLRNVGTLGTLLNLSPPVVDGSELCVGEFVGETCVPWVPRSIGVEEFELMPLTLRVTEETRSAWTLTVRSNDLLEPERTVEVVADIGRYLPCQLEAPRVVTVFSTDTPVFVRNVALGPCVIQRVHLDSGPERAISESDDLFFPLELGPGQTMTRLLRMNPALFFFSGRLIIEPAAGDEVEIELRPPAGSASCTVISPDAIDFGDVTLGCSSRRAVGLYNLCADPLILQGALPVGSEFTVNTNELLVTKERPTLMDVVFAPVSTGPRSVTLDVLTSTGSRPVQLTANVIDAPMQIDRFVQPTIPRSDVLFVVDSSPSFAAARARMRNELTVLLTSLGSHCVDLGVAFAPAEGNPDAGVAFGLNDAGTAWSRRFEPGFINRALSAFDALPVSSEEEACIGPARRMLDALPVPDGGVVSGLCITDALEQTPNAASELNALRARFPGFSWSTVNATSTSSCAVEAADDGVHASLTASTNGQTADVCSAWSAQFIPLVTTPCMTRSTFFLTGVPEGVIEVRVNGVQLSAGTVWGYSVAQNAVVFAPNAIPPPGSTTEISYTPRSCGP